VGEGDQNQGTRVDEIVKSLEPEKKGIAEKLRGLIKKTLPKVWRRSSEEILLIYSMTGKSPGSFFIETTLTWASLLGRNSIQSDLETGKGLRHVKIRNQDDMDELEFTSMLKEAARTV
jgi:hypothetical protein